MISATTGLSNRDAYIYLRDQKDANEKKADKCTVGWWCAVNTISVITVIPMVIGGIAYASDQRRTSYGDNKMSNRDLSILEGTCAGIIITCIAIGILVQYVTNTSARSSNIKIDEILESFPQQENSEGTLGQEHLLGGMQRKDLLLQAFPKLPDSAINKLNFVQSCILYEGCYEAFWPKRIYLNNDVYTLMKELIRYGCFNPDRLIIALSDINEQKVFANDQLFDQLIKFMGEEWFSNAKLQAALIAFIKNKSENQGLGEEELKQKLHLLRVSSQLIDNDIVINLDESDTGSSLEHDSEIELEDRSSV